MRKLHGICAVALSVLLSVVAGVMLVSPSGAEQRAAQAQYQNCEVILEQSNIVASGDAVAEGTEAAAAIANEINAPLDVVQECLQSDSGGAARAQYQNCQVIINQYNSATSGNATANGEAAVAEVASRVDAPINIVQKCIQGNDDDEKSDETDEKEVGVRSVANQVCEIDEDNATVFKAGVSRDIPAGTYQVEIEGADGDVILNGASTDGTAAIAAQSVSDGDRITLVARSYDFTKEGDNDFTVTLYGCVLKPFVQSTTLVNTGGVGMIPGTPGLFGNSPVSSVMIPAGALLMLSGMAGVLFVTRRAARNGEQ